ncbi:MAG: hydantoinase B/oxoprolinase family protein [Dehalococcoidia bacterium]
MRDPVRVLVTMNRIERVVLSMMNTLLRTARSGVINNARDFSCCILTNHDEMVAMAESQPIHVLSGPEIMAGWMKRLNPRLERGQAFLHNSPYHGNSHAADHSILVPVIDDEGTHRFTVLAKAHQADCGNSTPTTYMADARDVYEEGALIFPCVKVQNGYEDVEDIIRMCRLRIRVPDQWWGDYLALLGAARIGERSLLALGAELGWSVLDESIRQWFDYSEGKMETAISRLPKGTTTALSVHDPFPGAPEGIPIRVTITVQPEDGIIAIDLRDNIDCQAFGLNLTEATSRTAAMLGIFNAIGATVPANAGSFRRLHILLRENCVVGIPRHPASCSVATSSLVDRVANAVQRGLAEMAEGVGLAEVCASIPPAWGVISGLDPRRENAPFVNQLILAGVTCGPGGPSADGWLTFGGMTDAGVPLRDSVEIDEMAYPIRVLQQRVLPDSEGAGRHRGAPAAYVEYGPVNTTIEIMYASDGTVNRPRGARGGHDGTPAAQFKRDRHGQLIELGNYERLALGPDETLVAICCSGAGYGDPLERDPELVKQDVDEGLVTVERAGQTYGVAIKDGGDVDLAQTRRLRSREVGSSKA